MHLFYRVYKLCAEMVGKTGLVECATLCAGFFNVGFDLNDWRGRVQFPEIFRPCVCAGWPRYVDLCQNQDNLAIRKNVGERRRVVQERAAGIKQDEKNL